MFRIDADNDNKISYPEFQDIFYPLKHLNINYSTNMEKYFSIKEKDKDKDKKKKKKRKKKHWMIKLKLFMEKN